jgi:uncharacterized membrane protein
MGRWGILISHHPPGEWHRCYRVGGLRVCARCAGLHGVVVIALVAGGGALADVTWPVAADVAVLALGVPAFVDWGRGRVGGARGCNAVRTLTGALLGVTVARGVALNAVAPAHPRVIAGCAAMAAAVVAVEAARAWILRRRGASLSP